MGKKSFIILLALVAIAFHLACYHADPIYGDTGADLDSDADSDSDSDADTIPDIDYTGVDILIVVDNSGSMLEEQAMLATNIFTLVNALYNPVSAGDWEYPPIQGMLPEPS